MSNTNVTKTKIGGHPTAIIGSLANEELIIPNLMNSDNSDIEEDCPIKTEPPDLNDDLATFTDAVQAQCENGPNTFNNLCTVCVKFDCNGCEGSKFVRKDGFEEVEPSPGVQDDAKNKCPHCDYCPNLKSLLVKHIKLHKSKTAKYCKHCCYIAADVLSMDAHYRMMHPDVSETFQEEEDREDEAGEDSLTESINCPDCSYTTTQRRYLRAHRKRIHLNVAFQPKMLKTSSERQTSEPQMHQSFVPQINFEPRVLRVRTISPTLITGDEKYKCTDCDYSTNTGKLLTEHSCIHTGIYPYKCEFCAYQCSRNRNLKIHVQRVHLKTVKPEPDIDTLLPLDNSNDENTLSCSQCSFTTTCDTYLKSHCQRVHNEPNIVDATLPQGKHKCPECYYSTDFYNSLKEHLHTHTKERPFSCHLCPYKTGREASLKVHFSRVHITTLPVEQQTTIDESDPSEDSDSDDSTESSEDDSTTKALNCTQCDFTTTIKEVLDQHCKGKHSVVSHNSIIEFKCPKCEFKTNSQSIWIQHSCDTVVENPYICDLCSFQTNRKRKLGNHILKTHYRYSGAIDPDIGDDSDDSESSESSDVTDTSDSDDALLPPALSLTCFQCNFVTVDPGILNEHYKRVHSKPKKPKDIAKETDGKYKCMVCGYSTYYKESMITHSYVHSGNFPFKCHLCTFQCAYDAKLEEHVAKKHGEQLKGPPNYDTDSNGSWVNCSQCDYATTSQYHLKLHSKRYHSDTITITPSISNSQFKCTECNFSTPLRRILMNHSCIHTGVYPFNCKYCEYKTVLKTNLNRHVYKVHNNRTVKFRKIKSNSNDNSTNVVTLNCDKCDFTTINEKYLKLHIKRDHVVVGNAATATLMPDSDAKGHKCTVCGYNAKFLGHLKEHMCKHTGLYPFNCHICPFKTLRNRELQKHVKKHSQVSGIVKCDVCSYVTSNEKYLNVHMKRFHSKASATENVSSSESESSLDSSDVNSSNQDDSLIPNTSPASKQNDNLIQNMSPGSNQDDNMMTPGSNQNDNLIQSISPGSNQDDNLMSPGSNQDNFMSPGSNQDNFMSPGSNQDNFMSPGSNQDNFMSPGSNQNNLIPNMSPGSNQNNLIPNMSPGSNQNNLIPNMSPGSNQDDNLMSPGSNQDDNLMSPGSNQDYIFIPNMSPGSNQDDNLAPNMSPGSNQDDIFIPNISLGSNEDDNLTPNMSPGSDIHSSNHEDNLIRRSCLIDHEYVQSKNINPQPFEYKCLQCNLRFESEYEVQDHCRKAQVVKGDQPNRREFFRCRNCAYHSKHEKNLKVHIMKAHKKHPVKCRQCGDEFPEVADLVRHTAIKHQKCDICKVEFKSTQVLWDHETIHNRKCTVRLYRLSRRLDKPYARVCLREYYSCLSRKKSSPKEAAPMAKDIYVLNNEEIVFAGS